MQMAELVQRVIYYYVLEFANESWQISINCICESFLKADGLHVSRAGHVLLRGSSLRGYGFAVFMKWSMQVALKLILNEVFWI